MTTYNVEIVINGRDNASGPLRGAGGALGNIAQIAGGILSAQLFVQIGQQLMGMARDAFAATAEYERMGMAMTSLVARELRHKDANLSMGEAMTLAGDKAGELLRWIEKLAISSPFDAQSIATSYRQFLTFGFGSEQAQKLTQVLVDMSAGAGLGAAEMDRISYALGQINQTGKVLTLDLRQLMNAGVPVVDILNSMGFSLEDVSKGLVKSSDFLDAFTKMMGTDFQGAAAAQATSWAGLANSLSDIKKIGLREFFSSTFEAVQPYVAKFVALFSDDKFQETLRMMGKPIGNFVGAFFEMISRLKSEGIAGVLDVLYNLVPANIGNALMTAINGAVDIVANSGGIGNILLKLFSGIAGAGVGAGVSIALAPALIASISTAFALALPVLKGFAGKLIANILSAGFLVNGGVIGALVQLLFVGPFMGLASKIAPFLAPIGGLFAKILAPLGGLTRFLLPVLAPLASVAGPILLAAGAIMLLFGAFKLFKDGKLSEMLAPLGGMFDAIKQTAMELWPTIQEVGKQIGESFSANAEKLASEVLPWLVEQFGKFSDWFVQNKPLIEAFVLAIGNFFSNTLIPAISNLWMILGPLLTGIAGLLMNVATLVMQIATGDWSGAWETIKQIAVGALETIKNVVMGAVSWILSIFGTSLAAMQASWAGNWEQLAQIVGRIKVILGAKIVEFVRIGRDIVEGIKRGIKAAWSGIIATLTGLLGDLIEAVLKKLGISSPSKVFKGIGINIVKGMALGLTSSAGMAQDAMQGVLGRTVPAFAGATSSGGTMAMTSGRYGNLILNNYGTLDASENSTLRDGILRRGRKAF